MIQFQLSGQNIKSHFLTPESINSRIFDQIHEDDNNVFVSISSKKSIQEYVEHQSDETAKNLWKDLLIDSICLLKINDRREKLYKDTKDVFDPDSPEKFHQNFETIRKTSTYGIDELSNYFDDFVSFESVLYGTGEYYRDHIHHVISVWAIGIGLIEGSSPIKIKLNDKFKLQDEDFHFQITKDCKTSLSRSEIWAMWTIIALCHDLGYPLEKASQVNQKIRKIVNHFGTLNFNELNYNFDLLNSFIVDKYLNIVSSKAIRTSDNCKKEDPCKDTECDGDSGFHKTHIQSKYHDKLSKSLEDYKHGVLSGLLIFKKLTYFLETDFADSNTSLTCEDLRQFYIRKEILRAICGHTCPKIYHIDLNTLSFLLILCDEIQDWGRPRFGELLSGEVKNQPQPKIADFKVKNKTPASKTTKIDIIVKYTTKLEEMDGSKDSIKSNIEEHLIRKKFKLFHYLLRSAKDDNDRMVEFKWTMKFKDIQYIFNFNSKNSSYDMIRSFSEVLPTPDDPKEVEFKLYT